MKRIIQALAFFSLAIDRSAYRLPISQPLMSYHGEGMEPFLLPDAFNNSSTPFLPEGSDFDLSGSFSTVNESESEDAPLFKHNTLFIEEAPVQDELTGVPTLKMPPPYYGLQRGLGEQFFSGNSFKLDEAELFAMQQGIVNRSLASSSKLHEDEYTHTEVARAISTVIKDSGLSVFFNEIMEPLELYKDYDMLLASVLFVASIMKCLGNNQNNKVELVEIRKNFLAFGSLFAINRLLIGVLAVVNLIAFDPALTKLIGKLNLSGEQKAMAISFLVMSSLFAGLAVKRSQTLRQALYEKGSPVLVNQLAKLVAKQSGVACLEVVTSLALEHGRRAIKAPLLIDGIKKVNNSLKTQGLGKTVRQQLKKGKIAGLFFESTASQQRERVKRKVIQKIRCSQVGEATAKRVIRSSHH